ncbi:MAG: peptidoglycan recognition protein family protein [Defluviitaleaceae bacterium]|nr:peptidoglycan recognition protein family protein [Defluviitaleaceae bacterium]MCL2264205.1 peptidoglycan recognition protein family protein [Defluviitaleaceae bacterium]
MTIAQRPSPNRTVLRNGRIPDMIVNHITEGAFPGTHDWISPRPAETIAQYHARVPVASRVSYTFTISRRGEITQHVRIEDTAWGNGTTTDGGNRCHTTSRIAEIRRRRENANQYTISIGYEGRHSEKQGGLTPEQSNAAIWLHDHIRKEVQRIYGTEIPISRKNIIGHVDVTPRHRPNCPGVNFPFEEIISALKKMEVMEMVYRTVEEMPDWAQPGIQQLIDLRLLSGRSPGNLDVDENMMRTLLVVRNMFEHKGLLPAIASSTL